MSTDRTTRLKLMRECRLILTQMKANLIDESEKQLLKFPPPPRNILIRSGEIVGRGNE